MDREKIRIAILDYHRNDKNITESEKIKKRLSQSGADVDIHKILKGQLPNIVDYNSLVLSGSDTYNLLDRHDAKKSMEVVERAESLGKKVMAFCGGFELLAVVGYGLKYGELEKGECGFCKINLTGDGRKDSIFNQVPDEYSVLEVHRRIIKYAKKYKVLAVNKNTGNIEAIRFAKNILGMQGHPEDNLEEAKKVIEYYKTKYGPTSREKLKTEDFLLNNTNFIFENFLRS